MKLRWLVPLAILLPLRVSASGPPVSGKITTVVINPNEVTPLHLRPDFVSTIRLGVRLFRVHAFPQLLGLYEFHVDIKLFIEVAIKLFSAERTGPKHAEPVDHKASWPIPSAAAIAKEIRAQRSVSVRSCFFPVLVKA